MNLMILRRFNNFDTIKILTLTVVIIAMSVTNQSIAESGTYEETVSAGNRTYDRFCSVCHGKDAKGHGPYTENLKVVPANLTNLASNNNGIFPWIMMYQIIDGNDVSISHGANEMPIWGELFDISNWDKGYTEHSIVITRGRIFELLVYLDFIQEQ